MKLDQIKDPRLRKRIMDTMASVDKFTSDMLKECPDPAKKAKRIRQSTKPLMNKLEEEFFNWIYQELSSVFGTPVINIQSHRFKLANGVWYKPDFVFIRPNGRWTAYEVKGPHAFRGGKENLKIAAHKYPLIQWVLTWKENGQWRIQEILP